MTRAWDPDRYLPDPGVERTECPCPEGCSPRVDCGWYCDGCEVCEPTTETTDEEVTE